MAVYSWKWQYTVGSDSMQLSKYLNLHIYTARPKNRSCTLYFSKRLPFALITECICCGIVSTTLCNVTTFISIQSCIHFWPRFCIDDRRVKPFLQSFPLTANTFNTVKVRTLWWPIHVWKWLLMLHSFTTRARWILALLTWNMPEPSGKKKIHWWDNLVTQYIQELLTCRA